MGIDSKEIKSVGIVLVNWNGLVHTLKCIESLKGITYTHMTIILVDNGSEPEEVQKLREISGITLIENPVNLGFTGGNNVGIKHAYVQAFDFIMMLNNDTTVEPDFLEPLVAAFNHSVGAVQPKICSMHETDIIWSAGGKLNQWIGLPRTIGEGLSDNGDYDSTAELDWITGCALMFSRRMIEEVGYLDDDFFILFEDANWSLRCRSKGYILNYIPTSKIYHFESATAVSRTKGKEGFRSPFRQYINIRNHLFFVRKNLSVRFLPTAYFYQLIKITKYLVYYLLRGRWQKFRFTLRGLKHGLGKFRRIEFK